LLARSWYHASTQKVEHSWLNTCLRKTHSHVWCCKCNKVLWYISTLSLLSFTPLTLGSISWKNPRWPSNPIAKRIINPPSE
jgi:hypothetical protein